MSFNPQFESGAIYFKNVLKVKSNPRCVAYLDPSWISSACFKESLIKTDTLIRDLSRENTGASNWHHPIVTWLP